jgi:hypothetical protein
VHVTYRPLEQVDSERRGGDSPIGCRIPDLRIYMLDSNRQPVPVGVTGELYVGGAGVARGYLKRPELTAERFLADPFSPDSAARMYRTGDLGRWRADGNIEFVGRNDNQVKIRGFRIELGEIEARLAEHPAVREAVVLAREDTVGEKRLVAYYTASGIGEGEAASVGAEQLRAYLSAVLPDYMVPAAYVRMERLPLTPNGKLDRKALPAPEQEAYAVRGYEAPVGEIETKLAEVWAEVLKLEKVGRHDNFFNLGGHSLLVVRVVSRLQQVLSVEVAIRDLFVHPELANLAGHLHGAAHVKIADETKKIPPIGKVPRERAIPLSFAQQRLWFLDQLEPGNRVYHIPAVLRLHGELNITVLSEAVNEIVRRHETLRTTFPSAEGNPYQRISSPAPMPIKRIDLRNVLPESREQSLHALTESEIEKPFDLAEGPLLRLAVYEMGEQHHVLCLTAHHIICDALSISIFIRELCELYNNFLEGRTSRLFELPLQYADVAVWEREWLRGEVLDEQVQYWRQKLEGCPQSLELPTDFPRPSGQSFDAKVHTITLSQELSLKFKELSQKLGATDFMTVMALMNVWLFRYTGQSDILVGTPVSNRTQVETEQLIGLFLNTLVFRTQIDADARFADLVNQVRANALEAYDHQGVPFEKLVDELNVVRDPGRNPLFQVMLNMASEFNDRLEFSGLLLGEWMQPSSLQARFDIHLNARPMNAGLELSLTYNCALFQAATIDPMLKNLVELLRLVVDNPEIVISQLVARVLQFEQESTLTRKRGDSRAHTQKLLIARRKAVPTQ